MFELLLLLPEAHAVAEFGDLTGSGLVSQAGSWDHVNMTHCEAESPNGCAAVLHESSCSTLQSEFAGFSATCKELGGRCQSCGGEARRGIFIKLTFSKAHPISSIKGMQLRSRHCGCSWRTFATVRYRRPSDAATHFIFAVAAFWAFDRGAARETSASQSRCNVSGRIPLVLCADPG